MPSTPVWTSPAATACSTGAPPRYAAWVIFRPATPLISAITRCEVVPWPDEPWVIRSGCARAAAISSGIVRIGEAGFTITTCGNDTSWPT